MSVDLSIVIVNYRGWVDLDACLQSLMPLMDDDAPATEVVVVDNASGDGRLSEFRDQNPRVRFVENSGNHGFAHGCNLGVLDSSGKDLLFLNPDAADPGGQIKLFWQLFGKHPDSAVLTVRQVDAEGRTQKVFDSFPGPLTVLGPMRALMRLLFPGRYVRARDCQDSWREVDWVSGSALMIRRHAFERMDGWSDDYWMYAEDVDLCRRVRDAGLAVAFSADATLQHRHGGSSRRNAEAAALTRSEVIISKHVFASRHFGPFQSRLMHGLLIASRLPIPALLWLVHRLWPSAPMAVQVRAGLMGRLATHYRRVLATGDWRSSRVLERDNGASNGQ